MKTTYLITYKDYKHAAIAINDRIPTYKSSKLLTTFFLTFLFFLLLFFSIERSYVIFIIPLLFFLITYFMLFDITVLFILNRIVEKKDRSVFPKEMTLFLEESRFIYKSNAKEYVVPWDTVTTAVETNELFVFYTSSIFALYIVKKNNVIKEERLDFNQEVRRFLRKYSIPIQKTHY